jgi:hypothetical protein
VNILFGFLKKLPCRAQAGLTNVDLIGHAGMAEDFHRHVLGHLLGVVCVGAARQNHAVFMMEYLQVADGPPKPDLQPRCDSMEQFGREGRSTFAGLIMHVCSLIASERPFLFVWRSAFRRSRSPPVGYVDGGIQNRAGPRFTVRQGRVGWLPVW